VEVVLEIRENLNIFIRLCRMAIWQDLATSKINQESTA
jgi:hypothetical protein